jgi:DNA-dependent RNA polymerase auxiliary subunit epsilon
MAITPQQNQFNVPAGGYIAFDAMSLRQIIVDRLNEQGTFTDQNFVGSNLSSIIDIISFSYNTLIYYLNKTSTESMFTEAQLYENMNRIVKLLDYNPVGLQTSTLSFNASAQNVGIGLYTIPRYTYTNVNSIAFSFTEDITFAKTTNSSTFEALTNLSQEKFLYQGKYQEYPTYTAAGDNNEIVILNTSSVLVDHFNIDVYVYSTQDGKWYQYFPTKSLYLESSSDVKYEIRLNGNMRYEIKFGDDINGKKLNVDDKVAIYYLQSDGVNGIIGPNALNPQTTKLVSLNTSQLTSILNDTVGSQYTFLNSSQISNVLRLQNTSSSTDIQAPQTAEDIRKLAPTNFQSQYRLVTTNDYETFILTNFANLISHVRVINNTEYLTNYLNYFYNLGINQPSLTERALINQALYADSCNFNNVYIISVPRSTSNNFNYLTPAQKQLISTSIDAYKITTTETTFIDPVYKAFALGVQKYGSDINPITDTSCVQLQITKLKTSARSNQSIISDVASIFVQYFNRSNLSLGQTVDIKSLTQSILQVDGIASFVTARTDINNAVVEGLSVFVWNPLYPTRDAIATTNNVTLNPFEYPFYNNLTHISNYITVTN